MFLKPFTKLLVNCIDNFFCIVIPKADLPKKQMSVGIAVKYSWRPIMTQVDTWAALSEELTCSLYIYIYIVHASYFTNRATTEHDY